MNPLKVSLLQTSLHWQDVPANLAHFEAKLRAINGETDLVALPEMFTTGFTMSPETMAEAHGGPGLQWMIRMAGEKNCVLTGSIAVQDKGLYYNRLYWVRPDGSYQYYNKRHLFRMAHEQQHYTAGEQKLVVELKGWKICPLVCYDLRFPVWSRNRLVNNTPEYDLLIYVANWPEARAYPWKQLLIARAIENQCYVLGLNRVGTDGNKHLYSGDSAAINPRGELISKPNANEDIHETLELSHSYLEEFRKVFPVMLDADDFELK
jgi:predicted amidohydrolase